MSGTVAVAVPVGGDIDEHPTVLPGRTRVADRALRAVCEQASAQAFGVSRRDVTVTIGSAGGMLALRVTAPLPIPDLSDAEAMAEADDLVTRTRRIQDGIRSDVTALTGREVVRVDLTVSGARIETRRRVR